MSTPHVQSETQHGSTTTGVFAAASGSEPDKSGASTRCAGSRGGAHGVRSDSRETRKKIRPSERARMDFEFFVATELDMVGHEIGVKNATDQNGYTALDCWYAKDTHGQILPCCEPELLAKAMRGKASWNLQVKLWAEDIADGMLLRQPELVDYCHSLPPWIFEATMQQGAKRAAASIGFVPTFARLVRVMEQWWPPEMHCWSPMI